MVWVMIALFFGLVLSGVPVGYCLAIASLFGLWMVDLPLMMLIQKFHSGINSFPFLAIPFFIFAGALMETGGISSRLVNFAKAMVGHVRGGLGMVVVVSEILFSGISGSSIADASAIGSTMFPAMQRMKYSNEQSVCIISAASGMGILIPPCLVMIVLASIADLSVAALFLAGVLPGVFMGLCLIFLIYYQARKGILPGGEGTLNISLLLNTCVHALIPMMMPIIIFGGILGGIATATEVSVLAVVYALVVGLLIYREIKPADLPKMLVDSVMTTGSVMFLAGGSMIFAWIMVHEHVPEMVGNVLLFLTNDPRIFLIISVFIFILAAGILDGLPALLIFFPILHPIAQKFGINSLHFALIAVACNGVGLVLPPIGLLLIIVASIGKVSLSSIFKPMLPYVAILIVSLIIITFNSWFVLLLPNLLLPK
jgi:tripartite ATP-independent transporter DctM subunit